MSPLPRLNASMNYSIRVSREGWDEGRSAAVTPHPAFPFKERVVSYRTELHPVTIFSAPAGSMHPGSSPLECARGAVNLARWLPNQSRPELAPSSAKDGDDFRSYITHRFASEVLRGVI